MQRVHTTSCSPRFYGQNLETKNLQRSDQFLKSRLSVLLTSNGIEIQIPSESVDNTNVWVVISRGSNRHVDELRYKDSESSPGSHEEADYGSMQETDAEQSTFQSRPQCSSSDDHIPLRERKWEDITANEYSHKNELEHHISKFVGKLVRHENRSDRAAVGAIHWRLIRQKLKFAFLKQGGDTFTDRD